MARGFVLGALWGTVVAGLGAGAMSLMLGTPDRGVQPSPDVQGGALASPPETANAPEAPVAGEDAPVSETAPAPMQKPQEDAAPEGLAEASPPPEPETVDTAPEPEPAPSAEDSAAQPAPETDREIATTEAEPLDQPASPEAPAPDARPTPAPQIGEAPEAPLPAFEEEGATPAPVTADTAVRTDAPEAVAETVETDSRPQVSETPAPLPEPEPKPVEQAAESPRDSAPAASEDGPGTPAPGLLSRSPAVPQGRLASIGDAPEAEETAASPAADGPLVQYGAKVQVDPDQPRLAIVLIDDGSGPLGPDALESFPFPVTFAIAPSHPDAANAARAYRKFGFEVMAMAAVPDGAQAADVEVILAGTLDAVPEAIGVIENPNGSLQSDRAISNQVTAVLAATGHGLVTLPKGLNTAQQLAAKAGVPSATLFRDFDGEGQDATVIRRFLNQAALRSGQDGSAIMLGRLRADTISALMLWGLQDRASTVALVPVSLVLKESQQ
ncbi:divergent polysaccharide deacetylase family protein [Pacificoceanicola onchidii]|uniref:divergent polysaccharide deacetylase family protein n=1 Tax=Pacificoceanicola onchidii TaxID=2562685 RepID=UPI0010A63D35|nr:divergent polysaccharide deacetylase family protein [Pacificoceanicola onchidii]